MKIEINDKAKDGINNINWKWLSENETNVLVIEFIMNDGKVYRGEIQEVINQNETTI